MTTKGFTLLEVLVAFVIAALALGALTQGALGGLQATNVASHTQEALSRARSHLAGIGTGLQPGETAGDDGGGFRWRMDVQPVGTTARPAGGQDGTQARPVTLYAVTIAITWRLDGGQREVVLGTDRIGEAAPEAP